MLHGCGYRGVLLCLTGLWHLPRFETVLRFSFRHGTKSFPEFQQPQMGVDCHFPSFGEHRKQLVLAGQS
jgi:hypothetical protein